MKYLHVGNGKVSCPAGMSSETGYYPGCTSKLLYLLFLFKFCMKLHSIENAFKDSWLQLVLSFIIDWETTVCISYRHMISFSLIVQLLLVNMSGHSYQWRNKHFYRNNPALYVLTINTLNHMCFTHKRGKCIILGILKYNNSTCFMQRFTLIWDKSHLLLLTLARWN